MKKVGSGGMGEVWRAWDTTLERWVALKFLKGNEQDLPRFKREARTAGALAHPGIAAVYEAGDVEGRHYIAMQFVNGLTLQEFPRRDRRLLVRMIREAAHAVDHAHRAGIVHRDLKPANLMVEESAAGTDPRVYVMDFGLARRVEVGETVSHSGEVMGTPAYMTPEQARGEPADARSDVYALGATLYDLLTDRGPFVGKNVYDLLEKVQKDDPLPLRRLDRRIDRDLETIVLKCLQKDPARRYASAHALAADLTRYLDGHAIEARPASFAYRLKKRIARNIPLSASLAAIVVIVIVGGGIITRSTVERSRERQREAKSKIRAAEAAELCRRALDDVKEAKSLWRTKVSKREQWEVLFAQALEKVNEAIAKDSTLPASHYTLGEIREAQGRFRQAIESFDRALALDANLAEAWYRRGLCYSELYNQSAVRHDPRYPERIEAVEPYRLKALDDWKRFRELLRSPGEIDSEGLYLRAAQALAEEKSDEAVQLCDRLLQIKATDERIWLLRASALVAQRKFDAARATLDRLISDVMPQCANAYILRGHLKGDPVEDYMQALQIDGANVWAYELLGQTKRYNREFKSSMDYLGKAIALGPSSPRVYLDRAEASRQYGDWDAAIRDSTRALELDSQNKKTVSLALFIRGHSKENSGDAKGAIEDLTRVLEVDPYYTAYLGYDGGGLYTVRAKAKARLLGDWRGAVEDCQRALSVSGGDYWAFVTLGWAQYELGDPQAAIEQFTRALERFKSMPSEQHLWDSTTHWRRGNVYLKAERWTDAIEDYYHALELNPAAYWVYPDLRHALRDLKDTKRALTHFDNIIDRSPNVPASYIRRAEAKALLGDWRGAFDDCKRAIAIDAKAYWAYQALAWTQLELGDSKGSVDSSRMAIGLDPKNPMGYLRRGEAEGSGGNWKTALQDFTHALELDPKNRWARELLGLAKQALGDSKGAITEFSSFIRQDPRNPSSYFRRAVARKESADYTEALSDFRTVAELNPNFPEDLPWHILECERNLAPEGGAGTSMPADLSGTWVTSSGVAVLTQDGDRLFGSFTRLLRFASIQGSVKDKKLSISTIDQGEEAEGWLDLVGPGPSFQGRWKDKADAVAGKWLGRRIGPAAPLVRPALIKALRDKDATARLYAAMGLGHLGISVKDAVLVLTGALTHPDPAVRAQATRALGNIIPADKSTVSALERAVKDDDATVRRAAGDALLVIKGAAGESHFLFCGAWETIHGVMVLAQEGSQAWGTYFKDGLCCSIRGIVRGRKLQFAYDEPGTEGVGSFELADDDRSILGKRRVGSAVDVPDWAGTRIGPVPKDPWGALTHALADERMDVRTAAASVLGLPAHPPSAAVSVLTQILADKDPRLRFLATSVLARIGGAAKDAVPSLIGSLKDQDATVRLGAVEALRHIGRTALPEVVKALRDSDPLVRIGAAKALEPVGGNSNDVVPTLLVRLNDDDPQVGAAAANALVDLVAPADDLVPAFLDALNHSDLQVRRQVVILLGKVRPVARDILPALARALRKKGLLDDTVGALSEMGPVAIPTIVDAMSDEDAEVRDVATRGLAHPIEWPKLLPPLSKEIVPGLIRALGYEETRDSAMEALSVTGPAAVPALVGALKNGNSHVSAGAAHSLGGIGPEAKDALPALIEALKNGGRATRLAAAGALGRVIPKDSKESAEFAGVCKEAALVLFEALRIPDSLETARFAQRLAEFGPGAKGAVPELLDAFRSADPWVWPYVASAIARISPESVKDAVPILLEALKIQNVTVRAQAARALAGFEYARGVTGEASLQSGLALPALVAALEDKDQKSTHWITEALMRLGPASKDALPWLIEAVNHRNPSIRSYAIVELGKLGPEAQSAVPALAQLFKQDVEQRLSAIDTLGRIGAPSLPVLGELLRIGQKKERLRILWVLGSIKPHVEHATPFVLEALKDEDAEIRCAALRALGSMGAASERILLLIALALKDAASTVRIAASSSLGTIGPDAKIAQVSLAEAMRDGDLEVRKSSARALAVIAPESEDGLAAVTYLLRDSEESKVGSVNRQVNDGAILLFKRIGPAPFIRLLKSTEPNVRACAAYALGAMVGTKWPFMDNTGRPSPLHSVVARDAVPALVEALSDENPRVQEEAAYALAAVAVSKERVHLTLVEACRHDNPAVRAGADRALQLIGAPFGVDLPALLKAMKDENVEVRRRAVWALQGAGPEAAKAVSHLAEALRDSDPVVRGTAVEGLRRLGPAARESVPALLLVLKDEDPGIRRAAARALLAIGPSAKGSLPELVQVSRDDHPSVSFWAAYQLAQCGSEAVPSLVEALKHPNSRVRRSAVYGLGQIGPSAKDAVPALTEALRDPDLSVRDRAGAALRLIRSDQ